MKTPKTKVVFRKDREGIVFALFPEEPGTNDHGTCSSYERMGQHGAADASLTRSGTTLAKPSEYAPLARGLRKIGYRLQILKRIPRNALEVRREKLKAIR